METYCAVDVAALVVASVGGEVGGVELAASMMTVRVEVTKTEKGGCGRLSWQSTKGKRNEPS